ncbi:fumarylacetoacetate hydrolase family protein [Streptomyces sp. NPDC047061]|uniref:fumarylacetoacetate hydrolase family protein n=1 Tax=Streptomyces sp. NPDC047061 TaxID=3154605 RepID=UPI0033CB9BE1
MLEDAEVLDLGARPALETPTLVQALRDDGLMGIAMNALGLDPDVSVAALDLLPPVPLPAKIVCVDGGAWKAGNDDPDAVWTRFADTLVAPGGSFTVQREAAVSWRAGIAAVIGSCSRRVPPSHAHEMVAGYTCFADWATGGLSGGAAFGPWLLTPDEFLGAVGAEFSARVNGRTVGRYSVQPLVERLWELLAHCSSWTTLEPGDVVAVLAPDVAAVESGDICEIELPRVGVLVNDVL